MNQEDEILKIILKPKRILLIEDDQEDAMLFSRFSKAFNCEVDVAENSTKAMQLVQQRKYAMILLDLKMDPERGVEIFKRLDVKRRFLRVSVFSGQIDYNTVKEMNEVGCFVFISKPKLFDQNFMDYLLAVYGFDKK
jgi:DNA-binding NtrC family response regulator